MPDTTRTARTARAKQRSITDKPAVERRATASGEILLSPAGRRLLGGVSDKGDILATASIAGLGAMKRTSELIPHCHLVPLTESRVEVVATPRGARATARAATVWATGVEMEALVGVTTALLTVWDMVKRAEKDAEGQYPVTRLVGIRVVEKRKRAG